MPYPMKILKYLLYIIIALIFLFFLMGFIKPTVQYGHEITVNKSKKEAWAVFQDESKYDQWLDGFKSIDLISGEKGKVGSMYKVVVNPGDGQPDFEMIETVTSMKKLEYVELSFDSDMMEFQQKTSFSGNGGNVTIKTDSKVIGKGMVMSSMFAIMSVFSDSFQKQEEKNIEALKKIIENNTTDYFPEPIVPEEIQQISGK